MMYFSVVCMYFSVVCMYFSVVCIVLYFSVVCISVWYVFILQYSKQADLDNMVKRIVEETYKHSTSTTHMSPFARLGSQALSWEFQGGKLDDITVLLAAITDATDDPT